MTGSYFLYGCILEKCGFFWKNCRFSGQIWPDWGNTTRADMAGLGSIGLIESPRGHPTGNVQHYILACLLLLIAG